MIESDPDYPHRKMRVDVAFLDEPTTGIGPDGRGIKVTAGAYVVADLDGMEPGTLMLQDPDEETLMAIVPSYVVVETRKVLKSRYPTQWARYYRNHPNVLACWGEQNDRPNNCPCCQEA